MNSLSASQFLYFVLPLWLAAGGQVTTAQETAQVAERQKVVAGVDVRYGIVPASRAVPAHKQNPGGERTHGGTPSRDDSHHLDVALFDAASGARITNAKVWATVRELNTAGKRKQLDAETFGEALSYGNYFTLHGDGPFRIAVEARLPGRKEPVEAEFDYRIR